MPLIFLLGFSRLPSASTNFCSSCFIKVESIFCPSLLTNHGCLIKMSVYTQTPASDMTVMWKVIVNQNSLGKPSKNGLFYDTKAKGGGLNWSQISFDKEIMTIGWSHKDIFFMFSSWKLSNSCLRRHKLLVNLLEFFNFYSKNQFSQAT